MSTPITDLAIVSGVPAPAPDSAYRKTPLLVFALPQNTVEAGQVAGLRVDVSPELTPTPAAGGLVGGMIRVANLGANAEAPGVWALNTLTLHQGGAPVGGTHIRGVEVEVGHQESGGLVQEDPWAPLEPNMLRANGVEVILQANTAGPGTAALLVDSAFSNPEPTAKWRYGLACRGVSHAAVLDTSALWTVLIERNRQPVWGIRAAVTGDRLIFADMVTGRAVLILGQNGVSVWIGGALREFALDSDGKHVVVK